MVSKQVPVLLCCLGFCSGMGHGLHNENYFFLHLRDFFFKVGFGCPTFPVLPEAVVLFQSNRNRPRNLLVRQSIDGKNLHYWFLIYITFL